MMRTRETHQAPRGTEFPAPRFWSVVLCALLAAPVRALATDAEPVDALREVIRPLLAEPLEKNRTFIETLTIENQFLKAIANPAFARLDSGERHSALYAGSFFANALSDSRPAQDWILQASQMPEAGAKDWELRFRISALLADKPDISACIVALARRYPDALNAIDPLILLRAATSLTADKTIDPREPLGSLFDAHFRIFGRMEPSGLWRNLAFDLYKDGQTERALEVGSRIDDVKALIAMRADLRYAPLLARNPLREDLPGALHHQLQVRRDAQREHPLSNMANVNLLETLLLAGRFDEVLAASADMTRHLPLQQPTTASLDDTIEENWVFDYRARAFEGLGKWKEALKALEQGSRLPEDNAGNNVSQLLNLAVLQCQLGHAEDARRAATAVTRASPYGLMTREGAKYCAAEELGDAKAADASLAYLKAHRTDAPTAYEEALLLVNDLDGAASDLILKLRDEDQRLAVLLELQHYTPGAKNDLQIKLSARWVAVLARPDVKSALDAVGGVYSYDLSQ